MPSNLMSTKPLAYINDHFKRFQSELVEYLRFPSVSAQPQHQGSVKACADWIHEHCKSIGLESEVLPTSGHPVVLARTPRPKDARKRPHFLVYGHYDVQPPEPLDLWKSPAFEPSIRNGAIYARGSTDNKGQHFAHLKAVEAWLRTEGELPCDLTFLIEGEEEVGSDNLPKVLKQQKKRLDVDAVVVSDNGIPDRDHPALTYALRGIAAVEVRLDGPARDLHSGLHGGAVDNPAMALCQMLGSLRDKNGRVTIPGFYDGVQPLSAFERREFARIPGSDASYKKLLGVNALFGEKGFTSLERRTARPTVEINGLTSGYQGEGSKTIIPAWARAKLTLRLVPGQEPKRVIGLVRKHLANICPPSVRLTVITGHGGEPYIVSPEGPLAKASLRALGTAFERQPLLMREGGSIPIVTQFRKILGAETLLLGLALPDDNPHAPNEKFDLDCFRKGIRMGALLWPELAAASGAAGKSRKRQG